MIRFLTCLALLFSLPLAASAHAVGVEAKLRGNTVHVEVYYDDDTPAASASVVVEDETGKVVIEGTTDNKGEWDFPTPPAGKYRVKVDAGAGHGAKTTITIPPGSTLPIATPVDAEIISTGPSRSIFTGPERWLMMALGLGLIAAATVAWRYVARLRAARGIVHSSPAPLSRLEPKAPG